jgi:soluble cytochrome b562
MNRFAVAVCALVVAFGLNAFHAPQDAAAAAAPQDGKPAPAPAPAPTPAPAPDPKQDGKRQGRREGRRHEEETPLSQQMEHLEQAMHFLKRTLRDPAFDAAKRDACLAQVANAQAACVAAKLLIPKMAATTPEAERPAFVTDFRKGVATLLIEFTNLELALLNGDKDAALASYKKLEKMEDEGHNNFTDGG